MMLSRFWGSGVAYIKRLLCNTWAAWKDQIICGQRLEEHAAHLLHDLQLLRCQCERLSNTVLHQRSPERVLATACWHFPIYSQTLVYQELTQLMRHGFTVRFLYGALNPRAYLPTQCARLWHTRRRLLLHPSVCQRDYK